MAGLICIQPRQFHCTNPMLYLTAINKFIAMYFCLLVKPLSSFNHSFSVTQFSYRPISNEGLFEFGSWITNESWPGLKGNNDINVKLCYFQNLIKTKYLESFLEKEVKSCSNDKSYITNQLKKQIRLKINLFQNGKIYEANPLHKHVKKFL